MTVCVVMCCAAASGGFTAAPPQLPFVAELCLSGRDEQVAFCALYGAWLGGGSITDKGHLRVPAHTEEDVAVYDSLFHCLRRVLPPGLDGWRREHCNWADNGSQRAHGTKHSLPEQPLQSLQQKRWQQRRATDMADIDIHRSATRTERTATTTVNVGADASERTVAVSMDQFCPSPGPRGMYVIVHPRWCRYFGEQYGYSCQAAVSRGLAAAHPACCDSGRRCGQFFYDSAPSGNAQFEPSTNERQRHTRPSCLSARAHLSASPSPSAAFTEFEPHTPDSREEWSCSGDSVVGSDDEEYRGSTLPFERPSVDNATNLYHSAQPVASPSTISQLQTDCVASAIAPLDQHSAGHGIESMRHKPQPHEPMSPQPLDDEDFDSGHKSLWLWVLRSCDDRTMNRAIIAGYSRANGAVVTTGTRLLLTDCIRLRDELVLLCLHAGYTASFRLERAAVAASGERTRWSVLYSEDARLTEPVLHRGRDVKQSTVRGRVWCVTVPPHHLVLARSVLERDGEGAVVRASRPVVVGQCYQNALKKDPQNVQILKDLSQLQIQRRMADGYCETRRQLLMLKTNNRGNWLAYAIGHHLAGRHNKAIDIIDSFLKTQDTEDETARLKKRQRERDDTASQHSSKSADELRQDVQRELAAFHTRSRVLVSFEDSELHLYRLSLLTESRQWQGALDYLDDVQVHIADSLCYVENRAMLLLELDRLVEAEHFYRALLAINADNAAYHRGLQRSLGLNGDNLGDSERLQSLYAELQSEFPKSSLVRRLPLDFCHDAVFASLVAQHMKHFIRKAIPSLFADLRPLYSDQRKVQTIQATIEAFIAQLQTTQTFDVDSQSQEESPSCLLWTLMLAAQHYDHLGQQPHTQRHTHTLA